MKFQVVENDPNPKLERGRKETCLATWWHQATPGTTYWRCLVPARHLPGQTLPFTHDDLQEKKGQPFLPRQKSEVAIWQFLGDEFRTRIALGMRQLYGWKTLMEVDDNYLRHAPYMRGVAGSPWVSTIEEAKGGYSHERHRQIAPFMDGIICSTEYLADRYADFNDNIYVCPNSVDPVDWQYDREPHDAFRIVYYGSPSHRFDAPLVTKALKWAARQPGVEVYTVGFHNPAWSFPHTVIPWNPDLAEARKNIFKFDLGIAPLKRNDWANGKSDVKMLEYAMAGVMPLASDSPPYSPWRDVADGQFLVSDTGWDDAIRWAVKEQDAVKQWAKVAKDYVLADRTIQANIHLWREAING